MSRVLGLVVLLLYALCLNADPQRQIPSAPEFGNNQRVNSKVVDTALIYRMYRTATRIQFSFPDSAIKLYNRVLELSKKNYFDDGAAKALIEMGYTETSRGNLEKALTYFSAAKPYSQHPVYDKALPSDWYVHFGIYYVYQGKYDLAAAYFNKGLEEAKKLNIEDYSTTYLVIYDNLSGVYIRLGQPLTALKYLKLAEVIARKNGRYKDLACTLCNMGDAYMDLNKYDLAYKLLYEAVNIAEAHHIDEVEQAIKNDMGELLIRLKRPEEAIPYLKTSQKTHLQGSPFYNVIVPGYNLGQAYFQLGRFKEAQQCLSETIKFAEEMGFTDGKLDAYLTLAKVYEAQHDYRGAFVQQQKYSKLKDSLLNEEKVKNINEMEIKFNSAQKDKAIVKNQLLISQQQLRIQQKNKWIFAVAGLLILLLTILIIFYLYYKYKQEKLDAQLSLVKQEEKIKLLIASVEGEEQERIRIGRELHDGVGGLLSAAKLQMSSVRLRHQEFAEDADFSKAIRLLDEANTEIRKTAHNLMPEILMKYGLEKALDNFCEKIKSKDGTKIVLQVYGKIPRLALQFELNVYRIIQELINNILRHAKAEDVLIQLNWNEASLHVLVEDNGIGIKPESLNKGIGLKNLSARVEAMNGQFEIESKLGVGTSVYMEFKQTDEIIKAADAD